MRHSLPNTETRKILYILFREVIYSLNYILISQLNKWTLTSYMHKDLSSYLKSFELKLYYIFTVKQMNMNSNFIHTELLGNFKSFQFFIKVSITSVFNFIRKLMLYTSNYNGLIYNYFLPLWSSPFKTVYSLSSPVRKAKSDDWIHK